MSNVVQLFQTKLAKKEEKEAKVLETKTDKDIIDELDLEALARKNKANKDKLAKERLNSNKSVLKSYRIKYKG
jgi:hypothetical protein